MFQRVIDDFKASTGRALRLTSLVAIAAFALLLTLAFLCAAGFVFLLHQYGPVEACLISAAVFFVVAVIAGIVYRARRNQGKARASERRKSALQHALSDPTLVATGIQLARAIGIKRLMPIVAVAGLALGVLANRDRPGDKVPQK